MIRVALVGAAGALGALARYWIGTSIGVRSFPWATLAINVLGSFLLGIVLGAPGAGRWSPTTITAVTVGFLGAFTTFSTFAFEALFAIGLASLNLVLDFDMVEKAARQGVPTRFGWFAAFAIMVTLVWLYVEMLRLLSILRD